MDVSGAVVSVVPVISHSWKSGDGSTLPSGSTARTQRTCGPTPRPVTVYGDGQGAKSPRSSAHSKDVTGSPVGSSPVNSNVALVSVVSDCGPRSMDVSGELMSTTV